MSVAQHDEQVRRLTLEGLSAPEIAARLGITPRSVARARVRARVAAAAPVPLTEDTLRAVRAMLEDGASHLEISRTLPISRKSLSRHFPGTAWSARHASDLASFIRAHSPQATMLSVH